MSTAEYYVENLDPAAARRYRPDGRLDARTWWRSVRAIDEFA